MPHMYMSTGPETWHAMVHSSSVYQVPPYSTVRSHDKHSDTSARYNETGTILLNSVEHCRNQPGLHPAAIAPYRHFLQPGNEDPPVLHFCSESLPVFFSSLISSQSFVCSTFGNYWCDYPQPQHGLVGGEGRADPRPRVAGAYDLTTSTALHQRVAFGRTCKVLRKAF